jgi:hypothetical protein
VILIETKLLTHNFQDFGLFIFKLKLFFFTRFAIVVHRMFAEVYNNTGIENTRGIAIVILAPVTNLQNFVNGAAKGKVACN